MNYTDCRQHCNADSRQQQGNCILTRNDLWPDLLAHAAARRRGVILEPPMPLGNLCRLKLIDLVLDVSETRGKLPGKQVLTFIDGPDYREANDSREIRRAAA